MFFLEELDKSGIGEAVIGASALAALVDELNVCCCAVGHATVENGKAEGFCRDCLVGLAEDDDGGEEAHGEDDAWTHKGLWGRCFFERVLLPPGGFSCHGGEYASSERILFPYGKWEDDASPPLILSIWKILWLLAGKRKWRGGHPGRRRNSPLFW